MEKVKAMFLKYLPFFFVFMLGSIFGELRLFRTIDGDCTYLAKFRAGSTVYECVKYVSK